MKKVLFVDDEISLVLSVKAGFSSYKNLFNLYTASNGKEAIKILNSIKIDLVITDLKMPEMDGFELMSFINMNFPTIPVVVLTAFGNPEIEDRIKSMSALEILEKPIAFEKLSKIVMENLEHGKRDGYIKGISLPSFLQLIEMENKTCLLEIRTSNNKIGMFYFNKGKLIDALFNKLKGDDAVYRMLNIKDVQISFRSFPKQFNKNKIKKRITKPLTTLLLDGMRIIDEKGKNKQESKEAKVVEKKKSQNAKQFKKGEIKMADMKEILGKFRDISGFQAVGVFSPGGELVAEVNTSGLKMAEMGALTNDILLKAQKETEIMGVGVGHLIHIEAPKAHIFARCLNESTDFSSTSAGRAHLHMMLILSVDGNLAMAKMKLESIIKELAPLFR